MTPNEIEAKIKEIIFQGNAAMWTYDQFAKAIANVWMADKATAEEVAQEAGYEAGIDAANHANSACC